jgi:hypothetical protein
MISAESIANGGDLLHRRMAIVTGGIGRAIAARLNG